MKQQKVTLAAFVCAVLFFVACSNVPECSGGSEDDHGVIGGEDNHDDVTGEGDHDVFAIVDKTISGVSQKGPFVNGSSVTVLELHRQVLATRAKSRTTRANFR